MKVFVCVDDNGGVMFNHRRQSMDRILRARVAEICAGSVLWMNQYTAGQFSDVPDKQVSEDFLSRMGRDDYCFVEDCADELKPEQIDTLYLVHWNRKYPGDQYFRLNPAAVGLHKEGETEFRGSSHEKITMEVYTR